MRFNIKVSPKSNIGVKPRKRSEDEHTFGVKHNEY
jgi:hypothetical protein